jgi:hypothetical protein
VWPLFTSGLPHTFGPRHVVIMKNERARIATLYRQTTKRYAKPNSALRFYSPPALAIAPVASADMPTDPISGGNGLRRSIASPKVH